ncbi:MAG: hypothetical protein ACKVS5_12785 [Parvularculaceae bacterium]
MKRGFFAIFLRMFAAVWLLVTAIVTIAGVGIYLLGWFSVDFTPLAFALGYLLLLVIASPMMSFGVALGLTMRSWRWVVGWLGAAVLSAVVPIALLARQPCSNPEYPPIGGAIGLQLVHLMSCINPTGAVFFLGASAMMILASSLSAGWAADRFDLDR